MHAPLSCLRSLLILMLAVMAMVAGARAQHSIVLNGLTAHHHGVHDAESSSHVGLSAVMDAEAADLSQSQDKADHHGFTWDDDWGEPHLCAAPLVPRHSLAARVTPNQGLEPSSPCLRLPLRPPQVLAI